MNPVSKEESNETKSSETDEPNQEDVQEIRGAERVFFSPSAYNLDRKKGKFRNTAILTNSINYGLTDYFSVGGDMSAALIITIFPRNLGGNISTSFTRYLFSLKIKASYPLTNFLRAGAGARIHFASETFNSTSPFFSSYYGVITAGNKNRFVNFSAGYINKKNSVLMEGIYLSAGVSWRISTHWKLLADTFFSGVDKEPIDPQQLLFGSFNEKQPETYVFLGTSHMKRRHLFSFGIEIIDSFISTIKQYRIKPMIGFQLYF